MLRLTPPPLTFTANNFDYVYHDNNQIQGWLRLTCETDCILIDNIFVHSDHRGKGIATKLLKFALSRPFKKFKLVVDKPNPLCFELINFYRKYGFEIVCETEEDYIMLTK